MSKRPANIPSDARQMLDSELSKADLWEILWSLASLCSDGDGCDDEPATLARIIVEANALRAARGVKLLSEDSLRAKVERQCAKIAERRVRFGGIGWHRTGDDGPTGGGR